MPSHRKHSQKRHTARLDAILALTIPAAVLLVVMVPLAIYAPMGNDSGTFIYVGQVIADGGLPYVDVWDHKGPLLYAAQALGAIVSGGDPSGPITLETILLLSGLLWACAIWSRAIRSYAVVLIMTAFSVSYLAVFEGGNLTETWVAGLALPAFASVGTALHARRGNALGSSTSGPERTLLAVALSSAAASCALLIRPTNAGGLLVALVTAVGLAISAKGEMKVQRSRVLIALVGPALAVLIITAPVLRNTAAIRGMIDQYIVFNSAYVGADGGGRWEATWHLLTAILTTPIGIATVALLIGLLMVPAHARRYAWPLGVAVAVDMACAVSAGRPYLHYMVTPLPALASFCLLSWSLVRETVLRTSKALLRLTGITALTLSIALALPIIGGAIALAKESVTQGAHSSAGTLAKLSVDLRQLSKDDGRVFIYGNQTRLLAAAERRSPTRLTYLAPAVQSAFPSFAGSSALRSETIAAVTKSWPAVIVRMPDTCPFLDNESECPAGTEGADLKGLRAWIIAHYALARSGPEGIEFWVPRRHRRTTR